MAQGSRGAACNRKYQRCGPAMQLQCGGLPMWFGPLSTEPCHASSPHASSRDVHSQPAHDPRTVLMVPAADLVPYQADGWRYQQVSLGSPVEGVFMAPGFDDSGWNTGRAAFSSGSNGGCAVDATAHTSGWHTPTCY